MGAKKKVEGHADSEYVNFDTAKKLCEQHGGRFEMNNSTDLDAVMELRGWYHNAKPDPKFNQKAVWLGKVGTNPRAALAIDNKLIEAPANFETIAACKKLPTQMELDAAQEGCVASGAHYKCPKRGNADAALDKSLK